MLFGLGLQLVWPKTWLLGENTYLFFYIFFKSLIKTLHFLQVKSIAEKHWKVWLEPLPLRLIPILLVCRKNMASSKCAPNQWGLCTSPLFGTDYFGATEAPQCFADGCQIKKQNTEMHQMWISWRCSICEPLWAIISTWKILGFISFCFFSQRSYQYFEPWFNHLLFETLDIFSWCVAVKCFFSAVQQTWLFQHFLDPSLFSLWLSIYLPLDVCVVDKFSIILIDCHPNYLFGIHLL